MIFHLTLLASSAPSTGSIQIATVFAVLASAVIVLGGLAALVRAIWKTASILRDNTLATQALTKRMDELTTSVDGRFDHLVHRVDTLETRLEERMKMWVKHNPPS